MTGPKRGRRMMIATTGVRPNRLYDRVTKGVLGSGGSRTAAWPPPPNLSNATGRHAIAVVRRLPTRGRECAAHPVADALRQGESGIIERDRYAAGTSTRMAHCEGRDDAGGAVLLSVRGRHGGRGLHGDRRQEPRARGAVPDPGLLQRGGAVRAARRRVPGDDPGRRLRRRGGGAVPVRRHDARRRLRRAARRLHQERAARRARRPHPAGRAGPGAGLHASSSPARWPRRPRRSRRPAPASPTPRRSAACSTPSTSTSSRAPA